MAEVKTPQAAAEAQPKSQSNQGKIIIIVVIVLALCCVISACGAGVYYLAILPAKTTVTPTAIEFTVEPTSGILRITNFTDTFDNNRGWDTGPITDEWAVSDEYISGGKMHLDATSKKDNVIIKDNLVSQAITDLDLSMDGLQTSGAQTADYGLIFRKVDNDNYYFFGISEGYQEYFFAVQKDDQWSDIVEFTKSQYINLDAPNNIRVVAAGSSFKFYINDTLVKTVTDTSLTEGGEVGLAAELFDVGDRGTFEFDNFTVLVND